MAYANGEKVEGRRIGHAEWLDIILPVFNWCRYEYRVKPKQEKFDPKTLQPFDRVLVRFNEIWCCDLYSNPHNEEHMCVCCETDAVIPYNDETKHLVGTTDEAPEYYRYWEE